MEVKYAVTFEFESKPPLTLRGMASGSAMPTCVARAARQAAKEAGRQMWSSVLILIERTSATAEVADADTE